MEILQVNENRKGNFKALEAGKEAGILAYTWAGKDKFIIDHTKVAHEFEGKGVGKKLLMKAVDFARKNKLKIIPICPFTKSIFDKIENIKDVLFMVEPEQS